MHRCLKKILASRLFGVLTMLPTPKNPLQQHQLLLLHWGESVNEGH